MITVETLLRQKRCPFASQLHEAVCQLFDDEDYPISLFHYKEQQIKSHSFTVEDTRYTTSIIGYNNERPIYSLEYENLLNGTSGQVNRLMFWNALHTFYQRNSPLPC